MIISQDDRAPTKRMLTRQGRRSCVKEHIGDILAARATGLIEGMAKGFDMKGERWKRQDDEQKEGSQDNVGIAYGQRRNR